jgi:RNA polymerase sigma-70 factor (ECF subfamily)
MEPQVVALQALGTEPVTAPARPTDEALLRRHVNKDPDAFADIVTRHYKRLTCALRVRCNTLVGIDPADVAGEAFVKLLRKAPDLVHPDNAAAWERTGGSLVPWLWRVAHNELRSQLRKLRVRNKVSAADTRCAVGATVETVIDRKTVDPLRRMETLEDLERLQQGLAELTELQRAFVRLYYIEGVTQTEIAKRYNLSVSTVCLGLQRARGRLLKYLEPGSARS